jgi:hypothetical protein
VLCDVAHCPSAQPQRGLRSAGWCLAGAKRVPACGAAVLRQQPVPCSSPRSPWKLRRGAAGWKAVAGGGTVISIRSSTEGPRPARCSSSSRAARQVSAQAAGGGNAPRPLSTVPPPGQHSPQPSTTVPASVLAPAPGAAPVPAPVPAPGANDSPQCVAPRPPRPAAGSQVGAAATLAHARVCHGGQEEAVPGEDRSPP